MYSAVQKEKKKGFMTGDFRRRDEFTNIIRTEQYREQLSMEDKHRKTALARPSGEEDKEIAAKLDREAAEKAAREKNVSDWADCPPSSPSARANHQSRSRSPPMAS